MEISKAKPSERQESCAQGGAGKKSCPGSMTFQGQAELPEWHGKEAGWSWILFKTKFRKSVAEVSRNHGNPQARHLSTQSRKQSLGGRKGTTSVPRSAGTKPRPGSTGFTGKGFHSYDHGYRFFPL